MSETLIVFIAALALSCALLLTGLVMVVAATITLIRRTRDYRRKYGKER